MAIFFTNRLIQTVLLVSLVSLSRAQSFKITVIDLYGNRRVPGAAIRAAIGLREGDSLNPQSFQKETILSRMRKIPGVTDAALSPVCCDDRENGLMIYAGISESASQVFTYRSTSSAALKVPVAIEKTYTAFSEAQANAIRNGNAGEDDSEGHALMKDSAARSLQLKFIGYADRYEDSLRIVLRQSALADQRAIAAAVIAYAADKRQVVPDLLGAIHDSAEDVRNNAARALAIMAGCRNFHPALIIPFEPFIDMIKSLVWTDRNKGCMVLLQQVMNDPAPAEISALKREAIPELAEMAAWKDRSHAGTAWFILGRIAGRPDKEVADAFHSDARDSYLSGMLAAVKK
ncbi:MAG TPA: hypothetical protein VMH27_06625 [Puia sp.]|nr:hypothetical protein [Puia sp.]